MNTTTVNAPCAVTPTGTITLIPQWAVELRRSIDDAPPEQRCDIIAKVFGLRPPSDLPRPGEVAHYEHRDWDRLASDFGLEVHAKTTHSHMFRHRIFRFIVLSPAGTSGDVRGAMNAMSDFRTSYRCEVANLLVAVDVALQDPASNLKSFQAFREDVTLSMNDEKLPVMSGKMIDSKSKLGLLEPLSNLVKYLRIIKSEFGISFDNVFDMIGRSGPETEKCLQYAKNSSLVHDMDVSSEIVASVRDFLEVLRKEDRFRREQKRAERDARYSSKPQEVAPVIDPAVKYKEDYAKYTSQLDHFNKVIADGITAVTRLKMPTPPIADYRSRDEKIANLTTDLSETEKELVDANDKIEELQRQLYESEATNPWEGNMRELVTKLTPLLQDTDLQTLVRNLAEAKKRLNDADLLLAAAKKG
jgi:hypothetical protein